MAITQIEARRIMESLNKGIPADGYIEYLTVGRQVEIDSLKARLKQNLPQPLLLKANYGSGKTHLLRYIREAALREGYAVSLMTLDAKSQVKFNRLDQIFGAVASNIELPGVDGKGPHTLFRAILKSLTSATDDLERKAQLDKLCSNGRWDSSNLLKSPAMYIALRAWILASLHPKEHPQLPFEIENWIKEPWNFYTQKTKIYERYVTGLRTYFRDPRSKDSIPSINFKESEFRQAWDALSDLSTLAQLAGLKGLVLLFDEFENVLSTGINYQKVAYWHLFQFLQGCYPGLSFYAVTPDFVSKCKALLLKKGEFDYDYSRFDALPSFTMSPLEVKELIKLTLNIVYIHGLAYEWQPNKVLKSAEIEPIVRQAADTPVQDRARYTIKEVVKFLDHALENEYA